MKKKPWQLRIPTFAALLLLLGGIWVTQLMVKNQVLLVGQATPDETPQNIVFSNITDSSFSVSFVTAEQAISAIEVMEAGKPPYVIFDDRDKVSGKQAPYYSHLITVKNLIPKRSYEVRILSEGEIYPAGDPYSVTLAPTLGGAGSGGKSISGRVILPDGSAATDTVVTAKVEGGQVLSTLTDNNGNYSIDLTGNRVEDLTSYLTHTDDSLVAIKLYRGELASTINAAVSTAEIPIATLSYEYDFTRVLDTEPATGSSLLEIPEDTVRAGNVRIINPRPNAAFIDARPQFQGVALPNQPVKITIESSIITATVIADSSGNWSYRPPSPLSPGIHKITIQTQDQYGIAKVLTENFSIFASGSQVTDTATPSATPIVTSTPTPTPTRMPAPTARPTISVAPTLPISTIAPTPTTFAPSPTPTPALQTVVTPAPTGEATSIVLSLVSVLLIAGGVALLFVL